jgi:hypothetical protein
MQFDLDDELRKTEEDKNTAASALLKVGFTEEQLEQLSRYVHASIAHRQYSILKAGREIRSESAFQPGAFQSKIVR